MRYSINRKLLGMLPFMVFVICVCLFRTTPLCANTINEEKMAKLLTAVWKDKPDSIDVTVYETITKPAKSEQQIREKEEEVFARDRSRILERYEPDSRARRIMLDKLNRTIEMNVKRLAKEQQTPTRIKERIRISNDRERRDIAFARTPDVPLGPNTPFEMTTVDLGENMAGDIKAFQYNHDRKTARIYNGGWKASHIEDFTGLPRIIGFSWQVILGEKAGSGRYMLNANKVQEVIRTGTFLEGFHLKIEPDQDAPETRDRIELTKSSGGQPVITLVCKKSDYSRVYSIQSYDANTGRLTHIRMCSNFDSHGFPYNVTIIEYDADGNLKKKVDYKFAEVELNPAMPDEVFEFHPPEGYTIHDLRIKKSEGMAPNQ